MKKAVLLQLLRRWTKSYSVLRWSFTRNLFGSLAGRFFWFSVFLPIKSLDFPQFSSIPILPRVEVSKRQAMDIQHSLLTSLLLVVRSNISKEINILWSLSKDVFERSTSTGSEAFSLFIYLESNKFVLLSFFSLIKRIYKRVSTKSLPNDAKRLLPVEVRRSKALLLKVPTIDLRPAHDGDGYENVT